MLPDFDRRTSAHPSAVLRRGVRACPAVKIGEHPAGAAKPPPVLSGPDTPSPPHFPHPRAARSALDPPSPRAEAPLSNSLLLLHRLRILSPLPLRTPIRRERIRIPVIHLHR